MTNSARKRTKSTQSDNPLWGYSVAIETLVDLAKGKTRSRLRLEAAQELLHRCADPPSVNYDFEEDE